MPWVYDDKLSQSIYSKHSRHIQVKSCYDNVFWMCSNSVFPDHGKLKVLFCFLPSGQLEWYIRHAMCVYDGAIVEPLPVLPLSEQQLNCIVPIAELSLSEYMSLLAQDGCTGLHSALRSRTIEAYNASKIALNPMDLSDMVSPLAPTPADFLLLMGRAFTHDLPLPT